MKQLPSPFYIILLITYLLSLSAKADSLITAADSSSFLRNQAQISYSNKLFVYDAADLINPTLQSKFETELQEYKKKNELTIRLITLPQSDSVALDQKLKNYLAETDDVVILTTPRHHNQAGQIYIHTANRATKMISADSCRAIEAKMNETWLANDQYESATIETIDRVKEGIKQYRQFERNPANTIALAIGVVVLAIVLYKFSTASFKDSKKKMGRKEKR